MDAQEFFSLAQKVQGINAFAVTAQSALETGYWTSSLWRQTCNGCGLKAQQTWIRSGKRYVAIASPEYIGNKFKTKFSNYRAYASPEEFLIDYAEKIREYYPLCIESTDNFWGYFAGLLDGRWGPWATDPGYFDKLCVMAVKFAPDLLGRGWRGRLYLSFGLACDRGTLSEVQKCAIQNLLKEVDEE